MTGALFLCHEEASDKDRLMVQLLDFLGIAWRIMTVAQINESQIEGGCGGFPEYSVVGSVDSITDALGINGKANPHIPPLLLKARSVFVFGFEKTDRCRQILRFISGDALADIRALSPKPSRMSVTDESPDLCGPMSGISVLTSPQTIDRAFNFSADAEMCHRIISCDEGDVFVAFKRGGTHFYLHACCTLVDIKAPIGSRRFDVKRFFCSAVPPLIYLSWAFRDGSWSTPERNACLIIDDPVLKPRYGFLRFRELMDLMHHHDFTTAIALIPWNWRRAHRAVVRLFRNQPKMLSILVHGCDHTRQEFATSSVPILNMRAKLAIERMERMKQKTGLTYDNVMVFPQGFFSPEAARVLKLNNYVAAVNTELAPYRGNAEDIEIAVAWNITNTLHSTFPIFSRRYISEGLENFAFDILLGKPCLIVAHHDEFKDGGARVASFVDQLNSLPCALRWRSVGEVIRLAYQRRLGGEGISIVRLYGSQSNIMNHSSQPTLFKVEKQECDGGAIQAVLVNEEPVAWNLESDTLRFTFSLNAGEAAAISIRYDGRFVEDGSISIGFAAVKVLLRRWLSELRDQHLSRSAFLNAIVVKIKRLSK